MNKLIAGLLTILIIGLGVFWHRLESGKLYRNMHLNLLSAADDYSTKNYEGQSMGDTRKAYKFTRELGSDILQGYLHSPDQ